MILLFANDFREVFRMNKSAKQYNWADPEANTNFPKKKPEFRLP